jgi:hypothetical protein
MNSPAAPCWRPGRQDDVHPSGGRDLAPRTRCLADPAFLSAMYFPSLFASVWTDVFYFESLFCSIVYQFEIWINNTKYISDRSYG